MNDKYNKIEIAIIVLSIICLLAFIILFIKGFNSRAFRNAQFYQKIWFGLSYPIFAIPLGIPLIILNIILKKKKGSNKIYKLGIFTFIITFIIPLLLFILTIAGLMIGGAAE